MYYATRLCTGDNTGFNRCLPESLLTSSISSLRSSTEYENNFIWICWVAMASGLVQSVSSKCVSRIVYAHMHQYNMPTHFTGWGVSVVRLTRCSRVSVHRPSDWRPTSAEKTKNRRDDKKKKEELSNEKTEIFRAAKDVSCVGPVKLFSAVVSGVRSEWHALMARRSIIFETRENFRSRFRTVCDAYIFFLRVFETR